MDMKHVDIVATANRLTEIAEEIPLLDGLSYEKTVGFAVNYNTSTIGRNSKPVVKISPRLEPSRVVGFPENMINPAWESDDKFIFQTRNYEYWVSRDLK